MNKLVAAAALALSGMAGLSMPALAQDVGVSINVGQPGFYGQINIGGVPRPRVIYAQPVVIERVRVANDPIYLHVPPGHAKHWNKHCAEYNACGRPVYFVDDDWYQTVYVPHYHEHGHGNDEGDGDNNDHEHEHGNGNGNGHGHGHGHGRGKGNH